jgi:uncharacterized membrane protein
MADIVLIVLDYVHILSVMVWIGGGIYFLRIVQPSLTALPPDQAGRLTGAILKKFTPIAWGLIIVLGVGGLLRAFLYGLLDQTVLMNTIYGNLLLLKMALYVVMVLVGIIITRTSASIPTLQPQEIPRTQSRLKTLAQTNIVLGLITILISVA